MSDAAFERAVLFHNVDTESARLGELINGSY
jgi:hypothetical protein